MDIAHLHMLVAESDPVECRAMAGLLRQLGATRITEAHDGHSALALFQESSIPHIDVAVVDLALAGIDGVELIRNLASINSSARVIVVGAYDSSLLFSVETMALAYGLDLLGTIVKPVSAARLSALLAHYTAPVAPAAYASQVQKRPTCTFAEVGIGLQARQFEPFFQPKIELASGEVKGLEVFARWRHPQHGLLGPSSFIDALEMNNRIDFLDWTMIELSVERSRAFFEEGLPAAISINLAPETLAHPEFLQQISACSARHGVDPGMLTFEMPESAVLTNDPGFLERLVRLRMAGYGLAIDDYGTGRSNMQLLARIPFSELKIDRSFVDGASQRRSLATVLSSCMGLAHSLGRKSVAVGVETRQDWDFLQGVGCTYAQGYHIAKPMEAEKFPGWLADWRQFF